MASKAATSCILTLHSRRPAILHRDRGPGLGPPRHRPQLAPHGDPRALRLLLLPAPLDLRRVGGQKSGGGRGVETAAAGAVTHTPKHRSGTYRRQHRHDPAARVVGLLLQQTGGEAGAYDIPERLGAVCVACSCIMCRQGGVVEPRSQPQPARSGVRHRAAL